ncbi:MAG: MarR family transcriptional regulator [Herbiconiux sp.]|nr:MarR family transcriptional regulator [Herbiconiux sp.]
MATAPARTPGPLGAAEFAVWADFVLAYTRIMRLVERRLRTGTGLTWSQYDVLYNLNAEPGGRLSVSALSRTLLYSSGSASNLITGMERSQLVLRERAADDRRVSEIRMSDSGRAAFDAATTLVLDVVREEFADQLGPAELPAVAAFLQRVRERDPQLRRPPYDLPVDLEQRATVTDGGDGGN